MDDVVGLFLIVLLVGFIIWLIVVAFMVIAFAAAIAGVGYLAFRLGKAIVLYLKKMHEEAERQRRVLLEQERTAALLAAADAREAERRRQEEDETRKLQEQEERLKQAERAQQARELEAREQLEMERGETDQLFAQWNRNQFVRRPTAEEIAAIIGQSTCVQSHCGKYLHVIVLVNSQGVALQWKAHISAGCVPQVVGVRGTEEMFTEWAFAGRHAARLAPGRHVLEFLVNRTGQANKGEVDVSFEVFVPAVSTLAGESFKDGVNGATKDFISRSKILSQAKRKVRQVLESQTTDPDEIDVELAKFEGDVAERTKQEES